MATANRQHSLLLLLLLLLSFATTSCQAAVIIRCSTVQEIRDALTSVAPGDEIVIAPGTYIAENNQGSAAHFTSSIDGSATQRITLKSEDPSHPAILSGTTQSHSSVLRLFGDFWTVEALAFTNAQKGVVFDNADYCELWNCQVVI
jgi:endoglucanase